MIPAQTYVFNAIVTKIVDGDTVDCDVDLGLHCHRLERVRLLRVNAPELFGVDRDKGAAAKLFVIEWLGGNPVVIQTYKSDAFGRYLAEIWRTSDGHNLADDLIAAGLGVAA